MNICKPSKTLLFMLMTALCMIGTIGLTTSPSHAQINLQSGAQKAADREFALRPVPVPQSAINYTEFIDDNLFNALPGNIQSDIVEEAMEAQVLCESRGTYSVYNDCQCIGAQFVVQRTRNPDKPAHEIIASLSSECPNVPGVAGMAYKACNRLMDEGPKRESYCQCFANAVGNRYKKRPIAHIDAYQYYSTESYKECNNKIGRL